VDEAHARSDLARRPVDDGSAATLGCTLFRLPPETSDHTMGSSDSEIRGAEWFLFFVHMSQRDAVPGPRPVART